MKRLQIKAPTKFTKQIESNINKLKEYKNMLMNMPVDNKFKSVEKIYVDIERVDKYAIRALESLVINEGKDILIKIGLGPNLPIRDLVLIPPNSEYGVESAKRFAMFMVLNYMMNILYEDIKGKEKELLNLFLNRYIIASDSQPDRAIMSKVFELLNSVQTLSYSFDSSNPSFPSIPTDLLINVLKITAGYTLFSHGYKEGTLYYDIPFSLTNMLTPKGLIPTIPDINIDFKTRVNYNTIYYILNFGYKQISNIAPMKNSVHIGLYKSNESSVLPTHSNLITSLLKSLNLNWTSIFSDNLAENRYAISAIRLAADPTDFFVQGNRAYLAVLRSTS